MLVFINYYMDKYVRIHVSSSTPAHTSLNTLSPFPTTPAIPWESVCN